MGLSLERFYPLGRRKKSLPELEDKTGFNTCSPGWELYNIQGVIGQLMPLNSRNIRSRERVGYDEAKTGKTLAGIGD